MLFQRRFHEPIRRGEITCTVRIWQRPRVTTGRRYRLSSGAVQVDRVREIDFEAITPALARRSGFSSVVELLKVAKHGAGDRVYLIDFRYVSDPVQHHRPADEKVDAVTLEQTAAKLEAMDRRSGHAWTQQTLRAIANHPGTPAVDLASGVRREKLEFKRDVRKLKALGLTVSLPVGYQLSVRGAAVLDALTAQKKSPAGSRG